MEITTHKRTQMKKWLDQIQPLKILAPFGYHPNYLTTTPNTKIITRPKNAPITGNRKINSNLHAKLIIGKNYAITGSCNFTENSIEKQHEIMHKITDKEYIQILEKFFDKLWKRSQKFNGINDTI